MTYFLLTYDRRDRSAQVETFVDGRRAQSAYADLELRLLDDGWYEVVLLSAESEDELRITHSRFFGGDLVPA